jgi:polyisoprenoid-binding protein YceI
MRQVLEAEKYPFATLKVKALETGDGPHTFKGDLTLKGVTKPVKGNYTVESSGAEKSAVASFHILLSDFGVGKIEKAQLVVDPDIAVKVDLKASP